MNSNFEGMTDLFKQLNKVHGSLMGKIEEAKKHLTPEQLKELDKKLKVSNKEFKKGSDQLKDLLKNHI